MSSSPHNQRRRSKAHASRAPRGWEPLQRSQLILPSRQQIEETIAHSLRIAPHLTEAEIRRTIERAHEEAAEVWRNAHYQVHVIKWPSLTINGRLVPIVQLSIRRVDRQPCRDWRDLQRIKNQLVGLECEGIELYPAESRLVDTANQFHLWCLADPGVHFPFGYEGGRMTTNESAGGSVQRPLP